MSRRANIERHGLNHVPGGSDPIPGTGCCPELTICTTFPERIFEISALHASGLCGYWRLGDGASPYADLSGHPGGPLDLIRGAQGTAMTQDLTPGALPSGDDDGAVGFNNTTGGEADYLDSGDTGPPRMNMDTTGFTVTAWINPTASGSTFVGHIAGVWLPSAFDFGGWRIALNWPTQTLKIQRAEIGSPAASHTLTGSAIPDGEWTFVAGVFDLATQEYFLYIGGVLDVTDTGTSISAPALSTGVTVGATSIASPSTGFNSFCGGIDEVSVWNVALSSTEIASLYQAGQPCSGGMDPGKALIVGDSGTEWAYPMKVDGTRYAEILTGANLTSTDNTDGTVTIDASGSGGASPADTACWMPLTTTVGGDDVLVFDAGHSLIPTLVSF